MGLLDSVLGAALGQGGGAGGNAALLNVLMSLLAGGGQGAGNAGGGLGALVEQFQRGGMGDIMNSWISTGENQPISPGQLGHVLGSDAVAGMASQLGMGSNDLLGQLSQLLPQAVDRMTPQGRLPQGGELGDLGNLLGGLLGGGR
jgi:uncharacterized protein YidB (DUF937 family)